MRLLRTIVKAAYTPFTKFVHESWAMVFPKCYVKYLYRRQLNKKLDLKNPKDYNEKVQWLKVYSDISRWTDLADKYKVREYIEQCGLKHILVNLYGVWRRADDIDFNTLPNQFVLKTSHGFGKVILVYDKSKLDIDGTKKKLNKWVKERYGLITFEPHNWKIERRIIAEELLIDSCHPGLSSSLIDYKFWCLNGEPFIIMALYDRKINMDEDNTKNTGPSVRACVYDLDWNLRPEIIAGKLANDNPVNLPRPKCLDEMIRISKILSKPFPQVRVDLYEVNGKVYFGELTFTPGGNLEYFTPEFFLKMGEELDLSGVILKKRFLIF